VGKARLEWNSFLLAQNSKRQVGRHGGRNETRNGKVGGGVMKSKERGRPLSPVQEGGGGELGEQTPSVMARMNTGKSLGRSAGQRPLNGGGFYFGGEVYLARLKAVGQSERKKSGGGKTQGLVQKRGNTKANIRFKPLNRQDESKPSRR